MPMMGPDIEPDCLQYQPSSQCQPDLNFVVVNEDRDQNLEELLFAITTDNHF